jgi:hypothetical protein
MNFGYLIIVNNNQDIDYYKLAYALAISIKNTQRPGYDKVALVVDDKEKICKFKSTWVFDHIIEWNEKSFWDGRSYMDQLSPFESTVCLDADMLFFRDTSHWIDYFVENSDLYICNRVYTYRNETVEGRFYRKCFDKNNLPDLYSMYTFFKKDSEMSKEFFSLNRKIIQYPNEFSNIFLSDHKPKILGTDEAFALSSKILDLTDNIAYNLEFPKIVHMKPMIQNWPWPSDDWGDHVGFYLNSKGQLKIANYNQHSLVHYVKKDVITDEIINIFEEIAWKK